MGYINVPLHLDTGLIIIVDHTLLYSGLFPEGINGCGSAAVVDLIATTTLLSYAAGDHHPYTIVSVTGWICMNEKCILQHSGSFHYRSPHLLPLTS